jgi:hypothetical protein
MSLMAGRLQFGEDDDLYVAKSLKDNEEEDEYCAAHIDKTFVNLGSIRINEMNFIILSNK